MPKRKIKVLFYLATDGQEYQRGEEVDLSEEEVERGDKLNAFETDGDEAKASASPEEEPAPELEELTDEQIDALSGDDLDAEVRDAGVDPETGGSLKGGAKSVGEKREALAAERDALRELNA